MSITSEPRTTGRRQSPLHMDASEFQAIGHKLIDQLAERLAAIPQGPVVRDESPADVRAVLSSLQALPEEGGDAGRLATEAVQQLFDHSLFNGHPRFFGYITSSPA